MPIWRWIRRNREYALVVLTNAIEPVLETRDGGHNWQPLAANKTGPLRSVFAAPNGWWGAPAKGGLVHYVGGAWTPAVQVVETKVPAKTVKPAPSAVKSTVKSKTPPAPAAAQVVLTKSAINVVVHDMSFGRGAWYAASDSGVLVSHDSGASWLLVSTGLGSVGARSVGVSPVSSNAWAVGGSNLFTSTDGGKSWSALPIPFESRATVRLHAVDDSNLLLAGDHGLFESHDGGQSWRQSSLPELLIEDMAVAGDAVVVSTRSGSLYASRDEGRSWTRVGTSLDSEGFPQLRAGRNPKRDGRVVHGRTLRDGPGRERTAKRRRGSRRNQSAASAHAVGISPTSGSAMSTRPGLRPPGVFLI